MNTTLGMVGSAALHPVFGLRLPRPLPPVRGPGVNLRGIALRAPAAAPVLVSLVVGCGQLTLNRLRDLSFLVGSGKGDGHMCFYGSVEAANAALEGMVYRPRPGFRGQDTLVLAMSVPGGDGAEGQATSAQLPIEVQPAAPVEAGAALSNAEADDVCRWFMTLGLTGRRRRH